MVPVRDVSSIFANGTMVGISYGPGTWPRHLRHAGIAEPRSHQKVNNELGLYSMGNGLSTVGTCWKGLWPKIHPFL